jgi:hypothetical protein
MLTRIRMLLPAALALALPLTALAQAPRMLNKDANDRPVEIIQVQAPDMLGTPREPMLGGPGAMDPVPSFRAPMGGGMPGAQMQPPPLPPNAWPTYAPYNNYSRVAYPNVYPGNALPNIGPIYPFPKAPLGWRTVTLTFDDGHWYLTSNASNRDWWTLRYW